jgi:alcohol dehydrogenase class IV
MQRKAGALAVSGLHAVRDSLLPRYEGIGTDTGVARTRMAYAALLSGITLAQRGRAPCTASPRPWCVLPDPARRGVRHAGRHPHRGEYRGVAGACAGQCSAGQVRQGTAAILCNQPFSNRTAAWRALVNLLAEWTARLQLSWLGDYGLRQQGLDNVVAHSRGSSMQTNPVLLADAEIRSCLEE